MATAKKNNYIDLELNWLEGKAEEIRSFCDANPYNKLSDRILAWKDTRNGPVPFAIKDIEAQQKSIREGFKDYLLIIEAIAKLREKEDQKKLLTRGNEELTPMENGEIN